MLIYFDPIDYNILFWYIAYFYVLYLYLGSIVLFGVNGLWVSMMVLSSDGASSDNTDFWMEYLSIFIFTITAWVLCKTKLAVGSETIYFWWELLLYIVKKIHTNR